MVWQCAVFVLRCNVFTWSCAVFRFLCIPVVAVLCMSHQLVGHWAAFRVTTCNTCATVLFVTYFVVGGFSGGNVQYLFLGGAISSHASWWAAFQVAMCSIWSFGTFRSLVPRAFQWWQCYACLVGNEHGARLVACHRRSWRDRVPARFRRREWWLSRVVRHRSRRLGRMGADSPWRLPCAAYVRFDLFSYGSLVLTRVYYSKLSCCQAAAIGRRFAGNGEHTEKKKITYKITK